jgi:hypothetical protein
METFEKILDLNNEFEASILEEVLTDRKIPYGIVVAADSSFGPIERMEIGWGYVEAPPEYRDEINSIYAEITK